VLSVALPAVAIAEEYDTLFLAVNQGIDPLLILSMCSTALMVIASAIAIIMTSLYRRRKRHICQDYRCLKNPIAQESIGGAYDFREFETPQEFLRIHKIPSEPLIIRADDECFLDDDSPITEEVLTDCAECATPEQCFSQESPAIVPEVKANIVVYAIPDEILQFFTQMTTQSSVCVELKKDAEPDVYRGRHFKPESEQGEEPLLQTVPTMKHSRASVEQFKQKKLAHQAVDMDIEAAIENVLNEYARKIS